MLIAGTKQGYLCTYALPFNKAYALDVDRVKTHDGRITSLSLSPEGTTLFSSAVDGTVYESCITAYKPMAPPTNDDDDEVEAAEDGSTPAPDPDDEMLHGTVNAVIADDGSLFDQRSEIQYQLRRLAHHPSIFAWNGCNECAGLAESEHPTQKRRYIDFAMTAVA